MGLAVKIKNGCGRVSAKTTSASLVTNGRNRHLTLDIKLALHQMVFEVKLVQ